MLLRLTMARGIGEPEGYRSAGMYVWLLEKKCRHLSQVGDFYPRQALVLPAKEWDRRWRDASVVAAVLLQDRLQAGEPVVVQRWQLGGGTVPDDAPAWLSDKSVKWVRVTADDVIVPATKHAAAALAKQHQIA